VTLRLIDVGKLIDGFCDEAQSLADLGLSDYEWRSKADDVAMRWLGLVIIVSVFIGARESVLIENSPKGPCS
jgi:hypothetical protein